MAEGRTGRYGRKIRDAAKFFRLWHDRSRRVSDIAAHFRVTPATVRSTARRLGLAHREPVRKRERGEPVPTPEEIRTRVAEVQARWSAADRESRKVTKSGPVDEGRERR
jgi:hypothetical protein